MPIRRVKPADPASPNIAGMTHRVTPRIFTNGLGRFDSTNPNPTGMTAANSPIIVIRNGCEYCRLVRSTRAGNSASANNQ